MFFARKRSAVAGWFLLESVAQQKGFISAKARRQRQQYGVGTKALSQDMMVLAFVPLCAVSSVALIPKESPSRNENQLIHMTYHF